MVASDPVAEILEILRQALKDNKVDKATWSLLISKRDTNKIRKRLERIDKEAEDDKNQEVQQGMASRQPVE